MVVTEKGQQLGAHGGKKRMLTDKGKGDLEKELGRRGERRGEMQG